MWLWVERSTRRCTDTARTLFFNTAGLPFMMLFEQRGSGEKPGHVTHQVPLTCQLNKPLKT